MYNKLLRYILIVMLAFVSNKSFAQSLNPLIIGTLHPNDSIVVYYDVTINTGCNCTQISNQGTVSGSNFSTFSTDDPDTGPAGDATITPLNMYPLPVSLYEIRAAQKTGGINVTWRVSAESNLLAYEVEKSTDGSSFVKIGTVAAQNSGQPTDYSFLDVAPGAGANYYRLKILDRSAAGKYSVIVKVDLAGKAGSIAIFPNPVLQKQFTLQLNTMEKGSYQLVLYNGVGQAVYRQTLVHDGGSLSLGVRLPSGLAQGTYFVTLNTAAVHFSQPLFVQ